MPRVLPDHADRSRDDAVIYLDDVYLGPGLKRSLDVNGPGISLDQPDQPAVRVSWNEAVEFCRRLSADTGLHFQLPTEAQWEYACRAGSSTPLTYGTVDYCNR